VSQATLANTSDTLQDCHTRACFRELTPKFRWQN
jgi:hypothetical protein